MKTLILILLTILLVGHPEAGVKLESTVKVEESTPSVTVKAEEDISQEVRYPAIDLINQARVDIELEPLTRNQLLTDSATAKACDLRDRDYWAHVAPDGTQPWEFFIDAGYIYTYAGENLCRNLDEVTCVEACMRSKKHRENILSPDFKDIGIGKCGKFVVQHFGDKRDL